MGDSKQTVAFLARSLNRYVTGGSRRRIELANGLARRGFDVTMYTFDGLAISPRWAPLKLEVPIKERVDDIYADFVICGDLFEDALESVRGTFCTAKTTEKKIWLMQIFRPKQQQKVLEYSRIFKVANSTHMMSLILTRYNQVPWPALGGVDIKFFHRKPEPSSFSAITYWRKSRIAGLESIPNLKPIDASGDQVELRERYWTSMVYVNFENDIQYGWCNPIAEAMACGRVCVSVRSPHVQDLIIDGETGLLAEFDIADVKRKIEKLKNKALRKELVRNGLEHIKKFSWEKVVDSLETLMVGYKT